MHVNVKDNTVGPCCVSWQVRHRAVVSQGNLFHREIKLKYINVYAEVVACTYQRHVIPEDRSKDAWIAATWKQEWEASGPTRVHRHVSNPAEGVKGEVLCRKHWTTLNRLRTGVGRYKASMKKWGLADSAACECGEPEQTADHIINSCPLHRPPSEAGLFEVGPLTRAWLQHTELTI